MTPCGHNFCKACIDECLNRKHVCPLCNADVLFAQCHANIQLDNLLTLILDGKEKSSKRYFEKLFQKSGETLISAELEEGGKKKKFSPVEALFQKHMRKSLAEFNAYVESLELKKEEAVRRIQDGFVDQMGIAKSKAEKAGAEKSEIENGLRKIEAQLNLAVETQREKFDTSVSLLLQQFDAHLAQATPSLAQLPVAVEVVIESSNTRSTITIQPTDSVSEVRQRTLAILEQQGNPVLSFSERCLFFLLRPFSLANREMLQEATPLGSLKIEPGSVLLWTGPVKLKSDQPMLCFVLTFDKLKKDPVDYFSCKDCGINWVCAACVKTCHKGHEVGPYLKAHIPNWACCYCSKKGLCSIDKPE